MIEELSIRNVALIDKLHLELSPGLNVLTGETGAGKSVILQAVGLALGERGIAGVVRSGESNAKVQITVALPPDHPMWQRLGDSELIDELDAADPLFLSRQISGSGRSRCHVNEGAVNLRLMREVGDLLVDIHGQHDHQSLFRSEVHLDLLDAFGGLEKQRAKMEQKYNGIQNIQQQLHSHTQIMEQSQRERELLEYQSKELDEAELQENEEESLDEERRILSNAENLSEAANLVYEQLYGEGQPDSAILEVLRNVSGSVSKLEELDKRLKELSERLNSAMYELEDVAHQARDYRDSVEFNPYRLSEIEDRLNLIYQLKRKYGMSIPEILVYQAEIEKKLNDLQFGSEYTEELTADLATAIDEAQELAINLSEKRRTAASKLQKLVEKELYTLGMEKSVFQVLVQPVPSESGLLQLENDRFELRSHGMDRVEFLISPNVGSEPQPLANIASGGEISRVMLALKTILARIDNIPTMIYDEIDVGIGGQTADVVGEKLKELANFRQVLCITHLPQIACLADRHFRVEKFVKENQTFITAKQLTTKERVEEIARMHGGELTDATMARARELLR
ncbi:MAG: DNA repair protein RecN [Candidatus Poribacteria bacterium]|nr:DNA repair protein RecN [Candidatus Poribacteria bacterium]MDE0506313.1 DNA repair protein RecN [Candidatus Poribacteria bacterium]